MSNYLVAQGIEAEEPPTDGGEFGIPQLPSNETGSTENDSEQTSAVELKTGEPSNIIPRLDETNIKPKDEPVRLDETKIKPKDEPADSSGLKIEQTRRDLALFLVKMLAFTIAAIVSIHIGNVSLLFFTNDKNKVNFEASKDLTTLILSPLVTLTGAALGFYFGQNSKED